MARARLTGARPVQGAVWVILAASAQRRGQRAERRRQYARGWELRAGTEKSGAGRAAPNNQVGGVWNVADAKHSAMNGVAPMEGDPVCTNRMRKHSIRQSNSPSRLWSGPRHPSAQVAFLRGGRGCGRINSVGLGGCLHAAAARVGAPGEVGGAIGDEQVARGYS